MILFLNTIFIVFYVCCNLLKCCFRAAIGGSRTITLIPLQLVNLKKCSKCNQVFTDANAHRNHEIAHNSEPKVCPMCGKKFPDQSSLGHHQFRLHTGNRNIKCDMCDKTFNLQSQLTVHKRSHKPTYKCNLCNERFCYKSALKAHNNLAHGHGRYSGSAPARKKALKHIKTEKWEIRFLWKLP